MDAAMMRSAAGGVRSAGCGARSADERGTSILEVLIASAILVTLMAGLMSMAGIAISTTENQGHLAARTTEYAQDKMEQLLALAYGDLISDTRTFPAASTGGTGLKVGGSADPSAPVALYVDYLDSDGNLLTSSGTTAPTGWFYKRVWKVDDSTTDGTLPVNIKKITVATTIARGFGGALAASSVLVSLKTSPF